MRKSITCALVLLYVQNLAAETEIKGSPAELAGYLANVPRTFTITGESELKVPADRAVIGLKVTTENKSLQDALRLNQEVRSKIVNELKDRDIPADRIQASKFSSTPKYGIFSEKAKSYRVENVIKVTARDEKEFQATARLVDGIPEVQYLGIDFEHSDKEALKQKAIVQALDDADRRKKIYEDRLGVKLAPKGFAEAAAFSQTAPPPLPRLESGSGFAKAAKGATPIPAAGPAYAEPEATGTLFGEIFFASRVAVEYSLGSR